MYTEQQQLFFMRWAIQLGERGRVSAPPNPWVGCLIVKGGEILAEGFHEAVGQPHAEIVALQKAGPLAQGATAYITLEPCPHYGRTPPCTEALIRAGIKKVIIPLLDPDPLVSGKGVEQLRAAGIEVTIGVGREEAERSLAPYLFQRTHRIPFCVLKAALSLDGRVAAADGSSQWITGEEARSNVHTLRAYSQAIIIGAQTALTDRPQLTVRGVPIKKQPLRVVLDRSGNVPAEGYLADTTLAPTLIYTAHPRKKREWEEKGGEVVVFEPFSLIAVLKDLGQRGVIQALIEGGSRIHAAFLQEGLAHLMVLYYGSCLLGERGLPFLPYLTIATITQAVRWTLVDSHRLGNDVRLDFLPCVKSGE